MRWIIPICAMLLSGPAMATGTDGASKFKGWTGPKPAKPPCECRGRDGSKQQLGATMCMKRGERMVTLQCRLVLNNTAWQELAEGCDDAMF